MVICQYGDVYFLYNHKFPLPFATPFQLRCRKILPLSYLPSAGAKVLAPTNQVLHYATTIMHSTDWSSTTGVREDLSMVGGRSDAFAFRHSITVAPPSLIVDPIVNRVVV